MRGGGKSGEMKNYGFILGPTTITIKQEEEEEEKNSDEEFRRRIQKKFSRVLKSSRILVPCHHNACLPPTASLRSLAQPQ